MPATVVLNVLEKQARPKPATLKGVPLTAFGEIGLLGPLAVPPVEEDLVLLPES